MRKKTVEKISVSIPIQVANTLRKQAKEEHVPLSHIVARACKQYAENLTDYARDGALFSRAAFYAMCDVAAVARKEEQGLVQRRYLAKAARLLSRRIDIDFDMGGEGEE